MEEIKIPDRPKPFDEIDPINRGFYNIDYIDPETLRKKKGKMIDIVLYYSKDYSCEYFEKGVAIIVLDRVVMYHKIPESNNIEGFIYGEIHADYLHDIEDSMHSGFYDNEPWTKTKRMIEKWGKELVSKVKDLGDISINIDTSGEDYLESINSFLKNLLNTDVEIQRGRSNRKGYDKESEKLEEEVKFFRFIKTINETTEENISKYKRGQNVIVEIGLYNSTSNEIETKLKFFSKPNIAIKPIWKNLKMKKGGKDIIKFEYIIENILPRGDISFIAELFPLQKQLGLTDHDKGLKKLKPLDRIIKTGTLEKIIRKFLFTAKNYSREKKMEMVAEFDRDELKQLSLINTYVKTSIKCGDSIKRNNENTLKKSMIDINDQYQLDLSDERGKYRGYVEIVDKSSSTVIDKAITNCYVERFLIDLKVPT